MMVHDCHDEHFIVVHNKQHIIRKSLNAATMDLASCDSMSCRIFGEFIQRVANRFREFPLQTPPLSPIPVGCFYKVLLGQ